jgi:hypothetical protein
MMLDALCQKAINEGHITIAQARELQYQYEQKGICIAQSMLQRGYLSELEVLTYLSRSYRLEYATFADIQQIEPPLLERFSADFVQQFRILPLSCAEKKILVAVDSEPSTKFLDQLSVD